MKRIRSATVLRGNVEALKARGASIGFVPTMGSLHEGHLSLVRRARAENDRVVASIFVNPLQFGPGEDLDAYPRSPARDHGLLRREGVDLLFEPETSAFYPEGFATRVHVLGLDERLCGAHRPGHFVGVATVVLKLLNAAAPDRLYLGAKDYQQAVILERMVADLNLPVRVVICPTVREPDGLAMSSRNSYLNPEERRRAPALYRALRATAERIRAGSLRDPGVVPAAVARELRKSGGRFQYAEALDARNLTPVRPLQGPVVLAAAWYLGRTRLIDNVVIRIPEARPGRRKAAPTAQEAQRRKAAPTAQEARRRKAALTARQAGSATRRPAIQTARQARNAPRRRSGATEKRKP